MDYAITYHPDVAKRDLPGIPQDPQARIRRAIEGRLGLDPARYADRLRKDLEGSWKLRVGDYRIVFDLDAAMRHVHILMIAHRGVVYERILSRRPRG